MCACRVASRRVHAFYARARGGSARATYVLRGDKRYKMMMMRERERRASSRRCAVCYDTKRYETIRNGTVRYDDERAEGERETDGRMHREMHRESARKEVRRKKKKKKNWNDGTMEQWKSA